MSPIVTVDAVLLTLHEDTLKTVVLRRDKDPFHDAWSLPGGYVHTNEDASADDSILRVITEKIGIKSAFVEQLQTTSGATRDPRGWSLSVIYLGLFPYDALPQTDSVTLVDITNPGPLAFDHNAILNKALQRLRGKGAYSTLPAALLEPPFTLNQLQRVYEIVLGKPIETSAFRRKILALDLLTPMGESSGQRGRPSKLWCLKDGMQTFDKRSLFPA